MKFGENVVQTFCNDFRVYNHQDKIIFFGLFFGTKPLCEEDEISSDDEQTGGLTVLNATDLEVLIELSYDKFNLVRRVRQIVKLFKRSPLKNETLQNLLKRIILMD